MSYQILATLAPERSILRDVANDLADLTPLLGGAAGYALWKRHPVLGLLDGMAIVRGIVAFTRGDASGTEVAENLGAHAMATAGSLALAGHWPGPFVGYLAGLASSRILLRRGLKETLIGVLPFTGGSALDKVRAGSGTVKRGDKGDAVMYVQGLIGANADGDFGPNTEAAVILFQVAHSISGTGVVDQKTVAALDRLASGGADAPADAVSAKIQAAQKAVAAASSGMKADIAHAEAKLHEAVSEAAASGQPELKAAAERALAILPKRSDFFHRPVPALGNIPTWQALLGAAGVLAAGYGLYQLSGSYTGGRWLASR